MELEATIRTLQRKICLLGKDSPILANVTGPPGINNLGPSQKIGSAGQSEVSYSNGGAFKPAEDPVCKSNNELIRGIHKQVTSVVLKKSHNRYHTWKIWTKLYKTNKITSSIVLTSRITIRTRKVC